MYRGCCAAVAEVLSLVFTKCPRGVRGDCVLQHHQLHQHIDKALGLMRNNYNLFAHHSKTENWKKEEVSVSTLSVLDTNAATLLSVPAHPPEEVSLSVVYPMTNVAADDDERKGKKKKGGDTCFIYLYFAVGARLVASRQNFKVGIINSNAPFWVTQLGPELGMEMAMETKLVSMSRCDDESRWWLM